MVEVAANIEEFCSYFTGQAQVIDALDLNQGKLSGLSFEDFQIRYYKKVLFVTAIDTLAGVRSAEVNYPKLWQQNRDRFIRFVKEYSKWNNGDLISVPFLYDQLNSHKGCRGELIDYLKNRLNQFGINFGSVGISDMDVKSNLLLSLAKDEKEERVIRDYQHYSILYRYRNYLIHESREPGRGMEGIGSDEPYYHQYRDDEKWHLIYPTGLFQTLLIQSIKNLKEYLLKNRLDPFKLLKEDISRW